jgi:hypothetical protein
MHGLRRKLSEPSIAGHNAAASLCIQRMTSAGVSVLAQNFQQKTLETSIPP